MPWTSGTWCSLDTLRSLQVAFVFPRMCLFLNQAVLFCSNISIFVHLYFVQVMEYLKIHRISIIEKAWKIKIGRGKSDLYVNKVTYTVKRWQTASWSINLGDIFIILSRGFCKIGHGKLWKSTGIEMWRVHNVKISEDEIKPWNYKAYSFNKIKSMRMQ